LRLIADTVAAADRGRVPLALPGVADDGAYQYDDDDQGGDDPEGECDANPTCRPQDCGDTEHTRRICETSEFPQGRCSCSIRCQSIGDCCPDRVAGGCSTKTTTATATTGTAPPTPKPDTPCDAKTGEENTYGAAHATRDLRGPQQRGAWWPSCCRCSCRATFAPNASAGAQATVRGCRRAGRRTREQGKHARHAHNDVANRNTRVLTFVR